MQRPLLTFANYRVLQLLVPSACGARTQPYSISSRNVVEVTMQNGLPRFHIPLPSRNETCAFTVKPLGNTIGDLIKYIQEEDKGIDRVALFSSDGLRLAKSNNVEMLLGSEFTIFINDNKYEVDTSKLAHTSLSTPDDLSQARAMISQLYTTLNASEFNLTREREIKKRLEDLQLQIQPLEEHRQKLAASAALHTRRLTWVGLGALGVQFGLLARLTWWEYSWDIMEPVTYFVSTGTAMAMYAYYVITRQDYTFPEVFDREYLKRFYKESANNKFDVTQYNRLCDNICQLQSDLQRLQDPLLLNLPLQQTGMLLKEDLEERLRFKDEMPNTPPTLTK